MSESELNLSTATPEQLIDEFHRVSGVGNVTYENGRFLMHYPTTRMSSDDLTRSRFENIVAAAQMHHKRRQAQQDEIWGTKTKL